MTRTVHRGVFLGEAGRHEPRYRQECQPGRHWVEIVSPSMKGMPGSGVTPLDRLAYQPSLYGVLVDVSKGDREVPDPVEDPRVEPITPEMARPAPLFVVGAGEITKEPAHDRRKAFALEGPEEEMDMVAHHAEIGDLEAVALPGTGKEDEE